MLKALVAQLWLTFCDSMDCSLPRSCVPVILQARILGWVAIPFSGVSSQPRDQTGVSCIAGRFFTLWATRETLLTMRGALNRKKKKKKKKAYLVEARLKANSPPGSYPGYYITFTWSFPDPLDKNPLPLSVSTYLPNFNLLISDLLTTSNLGTCHLSLSVANLNHCRWWLQSWN